MHGPACFKLRQWGARFAPTSAWPYETRLQINSVFTFSPAGTHLGGALVDDGSCAPQRQTDAATAALGFVLGSGSRTLRLTQRTSVLPLLSVGGEEEVSILGVVTPGDLAAQYEGRVRAECMAAACLVHMQAVLFSGLNGDQGGAVHARGA